MGIRIVVHDRELCLHEQVRYQNRSGVFELVSSVITADIKPETPSIYKEVYRRDWTVFHQQCYKIIRMLVF